jgi:hypothetical protein
MDAKWMTIQVVREPAASVNRQLPRFTSASLAAVCLAVAVIHLFRYSFVELIQPAFPIGWLASIFFVGMTAIVRSAWRNSCDAAQGSASKAVWIVSSLAVFVWSWATTALASNVVDVVAIWLICLTSEACWWFLFFQAGLKSSRLAETTENLERDGARQPVTVFAEPDNSELLNALDDTVVQQLTRSETEERGEIIHGLVRCRFRAGERQQVQHVAFCPPLTSQPSILVDQIDGPAAKLKVAQSESFGARFEIRLDRVRRRSTEFVFEFFASTSDEDDRAEVA